MPEKCRKGENKRRKVRKVGHKKKYFAMLLMTSSWPHLLTCRKKETKGSRGVRVVQHSGRGDSKTTGVLGTVKHHREVNKSVRAGQMDSVPLSYHEDGVAFTTSGVLHR